MLNDIQTLGQKWHTAKVLDPENPNAHDYAPTYEKLFIGRKIRKVLEIGIGLKGMVHKEQVAGCSLYMWAERFPEAEIYGMDKSPDAKPEIHHPRIHTFLGDVTDAQSLARAKTFLGHNFDLIVDDCTHVPTYQARAFFNFRSLLADGGVYVIEDILPGGVLQKILRASKVTFQLIELNTAKVMDDRLIVVRA